MGDSHGERRRDERYAVRLPATLVRGKRSVSVLTGDVSFHGLFLRTDAATSLRQLLKIEMPLLPDDVHVVLHAMVVRIVHPGASGGRTAGLGVELVGLAGDAQGKWNAFIAHLKGRRPESLSRMQAVRAPPTPEPVRRRFERAAAELRLRIPSVAHLHAIVTTDVSSGGLFFRTTLPLAVGQELPIAVVHPETAATFHLDCVVRRLAHEGEEQGVGVEFVAMDEARRAAFLAFIGDEVPLLSASEEEIDESQVDEWEDEEPTNRKPIPR